MSGCRPNILDLDKTAVYTHCYGHSLNLAVGDTIKNIKSLQDVSMDTAHEISDYL